MLETLRERKAALEAQGKKGFTLMEMLIVIAIIAILIAIAIPVMADQLERANETTDLANIRAAYATATSEAAMGSTSSEHYNPTENAWIVETEPMKSTQKFEKVTDIPGYLGIASDATVITGNTAKVKVTSDGTSTVTFSI